jgi:hypothetical protein
MSDARVLAAIEQMEAWMREPEQMPGPDRLAEWNREFTDAVAVAERGPGWPGLLARAQALAGSLGGRTALLSAERDELRKSLDAQALGGRALKGYGATTR